MKEQLNKVRGEKRNTDFSVCCALKKQYSDRQAIRAVGYKDTFSHQEDVC